MTVNLHEAQFYGETPKAVRAKPAPKLFRRCCDECGNGYEYQRPNSQFCSRQCRNAFHNRRQQRGAEVYDFLMAKRFDRDFEKDARSIMDALAMGYRDQDKMAREGRRSWQRFPDAKTGLNRLPGVRDDR